MNQNPLRVLMESRMRRRVASPVRRAAARKPPAERPTRRLAADPTRVALSLWGAKAAAATPAMSGRPCRASHVALYSSYQLPAPPI
jgi:hypothetical protein